jgi:pyruvate dehydrogenase (quinone)/pyruvate oxidase
MLFIRVVSAKYSRPVYSFPGGSHQAVHETDGFGTNYFAYRWTNITGQKKEHRFMQPSPPNTASVLLSQLALWRIRHVYGVAGDAINPLIHAIQYQDEVRYIAVRHESAAAFMASAEWKCASRIGVCIGTSGPGLANMINGIADAAADHVPLLVITGQVKTSESGTETKQYVDQEHLISPLAVYSASLLHPDAALKVLNKAIVEAISKKGPAHVSIPMDVLAQPCYLTARSPAGVLQQALPRHLVHLEAAGEAIRQSQKPIIYVGQGARGASETIVELAGKLQAGIIETLGAKGTIPESCQWHIGGIGEGGTQESSELLKQSDCVLMIGANWYPEGFVPQNTRVIKIDTNPASIEAHEDIAFGLVCDAAEGAQLLAAKISGRDRAPWRDQIKAVREAIRRKLDGERKPAGHTVTPQALMAALEQHVAADGIIALDTGDHTIWFNRIFRAEKQMILFSGKWRSMGFALPAAISAKLQYPGKEVTALTGDGSFLTTAMELATLVKYQVPVKIIVANNGVYAAELSKMTAAGYQPYGVDLTNPDFAALAAAFGIRSYRAETPDELADALRQMYADDHAALLEVRVTSPSPLASM